MAVFTSPWLKLSRQGGELILILCIPAGLSHCIQDPTSHPLNLFVSLYSPCEHEQPSIRAVLHRPSSSPFSQGKRRQCTTSSEITLHYLSAVVVIIGGWYEAMVFEFLSTCFRIKLKTCKYRSFSFIYLLVMTVMFCSYSNPSLPP